MKTQLKHADHHHQQQLDSPTMNFNVPKLLLCFIITASLIYACSTFHTLLYSPNSKPSIINTTIRLPDPQNTKTEPNPPEPTPTPEPKTSLKHIVFGIAASSTTWHRRKSYVKIWWKPNMRGYIWMDKPVHSDDFTILPPIRISSDTSRFKYMNKKGTRDAIRIARIVSETVKLGLEDVRWIVLCDDDTVFFQENLVSVVSKYDYNQVYYIGAPSESHLQNMDFSYGMAYGGGGIAISYTLAKILSKGLDQCLHRYPGLYGSDQRIHACLAELGVPLTKEPGFHQCDLYLNIFGLLAAHPIAPLVSLHHLDVIEPIYPHTDRIESLKRLKASTDLDSAALAQQSFCYDPSRRWTISISWGYAVQIYPAIIPPRELELPIRTFIDWIGIGTDSSFSFNTRPIVTDPCKKPSTYFMSYGMFNSSMNSTTTEYTRLLDKNRKCKRSFVNPNWIDIVEVYKRPDPTLWEKAPRRQRCKILPTDKKRTVVVEVEASTDDETDYKLHETI